MLAGFKVLSSAILFLAVTMPSISHIAPHDTAYCFEALNRNYSLCEYPMYISDVQAIWIARGPVSTLFEVAELRSLHPDVASAPDHVVTSHPVNYSLSSRVNAFPVQYSTVIQSKDRPT